MPIKSLSAIPSPGHMIQVCAACGAEHTISFDRGAQKAKTGPTALQVGDTLTLRVDAGPPISVTFASGDFPDFARVTAAQLTAKINAEIPGARASDDGGGLLLESRTHGEGSRLEVVDGTARIAPRLRGRHSKRSMRVASPLGRQRRSRPPRSERHRVAPLQRLRRERVPREDVRQLASARPWHPLRGASQGGQRPRRALQGTGLVASRCRGSARGRSYPTR
jgi:hypothetical protein